MAWIEKHRGGYRVRYRLGEDLITENGYPDIGAAENRAADIESDQRRGRFVDPRLAQTTIDEMSAAAVPQVQVGEWRCGPPGAVLVAKAIDAAM